MGGYNSVEFAELHKNILLDASDACVAARKALAQVRAWKMPHKDNVFEVEKAIDVTTMIGDYGYHLMLAKATVDKLFKFECAYVPIGRADRKPAPTIPKPDVMSPTRLVSQTGNRLLMNLAE